MCLTTRPTDVKEFLKKHPRGEVTVYKVLCRRGRCLKSVIFSVKDWEPGWTEGTSRRTKCSKRCEDIGPGIHVYTSKPRADDKVWPSSGTIVVAFKADVADLLGVNVYTKQAVFRRVRLSGYSYRKALRRA